MGLTRRWDSLVWFLKSANTHDSGLLQGARAGSAAAAVAIAWGRGSRLINRAWVGFLVAEVLVEGGRERRDGVYGAAVVCCGGDAVSALGYI